MTAASKSVKCFRYICTCVLISCTVFFQVPSVVCQIYNGDFPISMLPFCVGFPCALRPGHEIKITFSSELSASADGWLDITLLSECSRTESPFDLKIRFDNQLLIRNSFQNGNWGDEDTGGPFPFSLGVQCVLQIEVQPDGYKVTGNGAPLWTFAHRLTDTNVLTLKASGKSTNIWKVELMDKANKNQPGISQIIYPIPLVPQPVSHPSFPFWGYFPEGLEAGKSILIEGAFPSDLERTSINLCANCFKGPVMLHLDLRFAYGNDVNQAVRNTVHGGIWGSEERGGLFPFGIREPFTMLIHVQQDSYKFEVNGLHCWTFMHRLPFTQVTEMTIERGPMNIWKVQYIDTNGENEKFSKALTPVCAEPPKPFAEVSTLATETSILSTKVLPPTVTSTPAESPTPSIKVPTPSAEVYTTSMEAPVPSMETPTPTTEASTPSAEALTPSTETQTPSSEIPFSSSQVQSPSSVVPTISVEMQDTSVKALIPSPEAMTLGTEVKAPAEDATTTTAISASSGFRIYCTPAYYSFLLITLTWFLLLV